VALEIPDPCLVVLVGAAGSGKSTFAARHFAPDEVLSSDAFRGLIAGDPADQTATRAAFSALHKALAQRLSQGRLTVVDATSVQRAARVALLRRAAAAGVPAVAVVLALPPEVVHARNHGRPAGGVVPAAAVDRQLADLASALRPDGIDAEGFARIHVLTTPDAVDAAVVLRVPGQRGPA
jgi:predicted kinase